MDAKIVKKRKIYSKSFHESHLCPLFYLKINSEDIAEI